jgi:hypothetical protein
MFKKLNKQTLREKELRKNSRGSLERSQEIDNKIKKEAEFPGPINNSE